MWGTGRAERTEVFGVRRGLSLVAVAAVSVGLVATSASADSAPVTQTSYRGLPAGWRAVTVSCATHKQIPTDIAHVRGPATPPYGRGSLRVSQAKSTTAIAIKAPGRTPPLLNTLTAVNSSFYSPVSGGLIPSLSLEVTVGPTSFTLIGLMVRRGVWINRDLRAGANLVWVNNTSGNVVSGTLAQFEKDYPMATLDGFVILGTSSSGAICRAGSFYLDGFHYTVGGTNVKVNFEAPLVTTLTNVARPAKTPAHRLTHVSVRLKQGTRQLVGASVQLWVRPKGVTGFRLLRTVKTNRTGLAATLVAPGKTTSYQWRYRGVGPDASSRGVVFTIVTR